MSTRWLAIVIVGAALAAASEEDGWDDDWDQDWDDDEPALVTGFVEAALGARLDGSSPHRETLADGRLRVEAAASGLAITGSLKADVALDGVEDDVRLEVREASLAFSPFGDVDVEIGQQVLTWGTGDLVFLNDLFPKSWVSFFAGRENEYLKDPTLAVRATAYNDLVNVDLAWMPRFQADQTLDGERFSFYLPSTRTVAAPSPPLDASEPDGTETALRLFRRWGAAEIEAYAYRGYFKQPTAIDASGRPTHSRMNAYGLSARAPMGPALVNAEASFYDSRDDRRGDDPGTPNSESRLLVGWEREIAQNLNLGVQGYVERIHDHGRLLAESSAPELERERTRTLVTTRLTYRTRRDTRVWSLFVFYSPTDDDYYARPTLTLKPTDQWWITVGANLFGGAQNHTFFGQLEDNVNAYVRVRRYY